MVVDISYKKPKLTRDLDIIKNTFILNCNEFSFKERVEFPLFSSVEFYRDFYDDIRLEYLVDFNKSTQEEDTFVMNPEYRTLARETFYTMENPISNYDFYYIQETMSYDSPNRNNIIQDKVFGICSFEPTDEDDSWLQLQECASRFINLIIRKGCSPSSHEFGNTIVYKINDERVGFGKNESDKGFMSIHFSLNDITKALNINK